MSEAFSPHGVDLFGEPLEAHGRSPVAQRFLAPPFSVLNAREGTWQDRKRAWLRMGIESEVGRDQNLAKMSETVTREFGHFTNVSIFDPVVCELVYRWFSPAGGQVVDPFAGGSVRGVVASALDRDYWGGELRQEQVNANREQVGELCPGRLPVYDCGDSLKTLPTAPVADLVFSCPPYGDLERYSDDPRDLSAMEWHTFVAAYKRIILRACNRLKPDRFACFVVGDFRDKRGFYRDFVSTTVEAFRECRLELYNEAVLVTAVGSASMRVSKQFAAGRKFAKTHQNVLVFCKGDWRKAAASCGEI